MVPPTKPRVDCVSFLITKDDSILVEKRDNKRATDPNIIAIPGGHVNSNESLEEACQREMLEEVGLTCESCELVETIEHETPLETQVVHYYLCVDWFGEIESNEAEFVFWLPFSELSKLDYDFERRIVESLK